MSVELTIKDVAGRAGADVGYVRRFDLGGADARGGPAPQPRRAPALLHL
jgi:hypothetical protein